MCPIEGVSGIVRIPRLGKIHLGVKATSDRTGGQYPKATEYFVVPDEVKAVYGDKPKELDIMFPVEDPNQFAQQWLRAYSLTQGLICIGDGVNARQKIDVATGAIADHETKGWEWHEIACDPQECTEYQTKRCRRVMNLQFLLPMVPGLGVYQVDTSSFYSIVNINSMVKMLQGLFQRCSMIPLTLALGPIEVSPPGQTKKTVYIMHIKKNVTLAELAKVAQLPPGKVLLPEPETEEPPEDLFPAAALAQQEKAAGVATLTPSPLEGEGSLAAPTEAELPADEELVKGWNIVKATVKKLKLTDKQVGQWFLRYGFDVKLSDFDKDLPPLQVTNELLSKFQTSLDTHQERQRERQ